MPAPDPERWPALALSVTPVSPDRNALWRWFRRKYPHVPVGARAANLEILTGRELVEYVQDQVEEATKVSWVDTALVDEIASLRLQLEQARAERDEMKARLAG